MMGSASILREFLNVEKDYPICLSLSHGVDFNHTTHAYDIESIEPIHWAYNEEIFKRSINVKTSIKIPHPWLLLHELRKSESILKNSETLIIAPPPSLENDINLFNLISERDPKNLKILVKHRGNKNKIDSSVEFWESKGIKTISAGPPDNSFYKNLYNILSSHENILACTMSSAVIFGVAIGCKCELIDNYFAQGYETANYLEKTSFYSKSFNINSSREIIISIENNNFKLATDLSKKILGKDFLQFQDNIKGNLEDKYKKLSSPFNEYKNGKIILMIKLFLFKILKKKSIIDGNFFKNLASRLNPNITFVVMNEIDVFRNGVNEGNFNIKKIKYKKGENDPGSA